MPFPAWSRTSVTSNSTLTTQSIILPTFVAGDLYVVLAGGNAGDSFDTVPSGFTTLVNTSTVGDPRAVVYRVMETGDNRTASFHQSGGTRFAAIAYKFNSGSYVGVPEISQVLNVNSNVTTVNPPAASASWTVNNNIDTFWGTFLINGGGGDPSVYPDGISDTLSIAPTLVRMSIGHFYNRESQIEPTAFIWTPGAEANTTSTFMVRGIFYTGSYMLINITGSGRSVASFDPNGMGVATIN